MVTAILLHFSYADKLQSGAATGKIQGYCLDMSAKKRNIEQNINQLLNFFPVVLILGVRQCGKTTLAKEIRKSWKYFDLENGSDFDFISNDLEFFFTEYPEQVIIDEAQDLPVLFKHLRGVIDKDRARKNRFILTGSSSPELIHLAGDTLAGRIGIVELGTFKMNEITGKPLSPFYEIFENDLSAGSMELLKKIIPPASKDSNSIDMFLKGGYPDPVLSGDNEFYDRWMENYFHTYINRDIKKLFPKMDSIKFRRFISTLSELSGTIINKAQLGRSIDVSEVTIRDYLDIADKTFIWRIIPSYEKTRVKSVTKMPKGILRDSGLLHYLSGIDNREKLIRSPRVGQNFESFVIEEIIKGVQSTKAVGWNYSYFRTKHGAEVDLILEGKFGTLPIKVKFSATTAASQLSSLKKFIEQHEASFGVVINNSKEIRMIQSNIIQIPVGCV